ncbi:hypothetical protein Aduo_008727 [Ancylostoma duodenale]
MRMISAYAPQVGCTAKEKSSFYEVAISLVTLENSGKALTAGMHNEEGQRILECAAVSDLIIANTQFRKRKSHLATFTSGGREAQSDLWMLRRRDRKILADTKVIPSDHVAAQHHLLVMDLKICCPKKVRPGTDTQRIEW